VSAAIHVLPQTMPSAAKANHCLGEGFMGSGKGLGW
jgi:hypothetical protein